MLQILDFKTIPTLFYEPFLSTTLYSQLVINTLELKVYCFLRSLVLERHIYFPWINFSFDTVHLGVFLVVMGENDFVLLPLWMTVWLGIRFWVQNISHDHCHLTFYVQVRSLTASLIFHPFRGNQMLLFRSLWDFIFTCELHKFHQNVSRFVY